MRALAVRRRRRSTASPARRRARGAPRAGGGRLRGRAGADRARGGAPRLAAGAGLAASPPLGAGCATRRVLRDLASARPGRRRRSRPGRSCPVKWFVERLLRPAALEPDPEPMVRGDLAHRVLEDTLRALSRRRPAHARAPRRGPRAAARRARRARRRRADLAQPRAPARGAAAPGGRPAALPRARRPRPARPSRRASSSCASAAPEDPLGPAELAGGELRLQGRIDRIDVSADGDEAIVYDYKGKSAPPQARWIEDAQPPGRPLPARAAAAARASRPVGGLYQPLGRDDDGRPRGLLLDGADPGLDERRRRTAWRPRTFEALLAEVLDAALRGGAPACAPGALEPRPDLVRVPRRLRAPDHLPLRGGLGVTRAFTPEQREAIARRDGRPLLLGQRRLGQDVGAGRALRRARSSRTACAPAGSWPSRSPRRRRASCARACAPACSSSATARRRARPRPRGSRPSTASARGSCARTRSPPGLDPGFAVLDEADGPRRCAPGLRGARWPTSSAGRPRADALDLAAGLRRRPRCSAWSSPRTTSCAARGQTRPALPARRAPADLDAARAELRARVRGVRGRARGRRAPARRSTRRARRSRPAARALDGRRAPSHPTGAKVGAQRRRAARRPLPTPTARRCEAYARRARRSPRRPGAGAARRAAGALRRRLRGGQARPRRRRLRRPRAARARPAGPRARHRRRLRASASSGSWSTSSRTPTPLQLELLELARRATTPARSATSCSRSTPSAMPTSRSSARAASAWRPRAGPRRWRPTSARARRSCGALNGAFGAMHEHWVEPCARARDDAPGAGAAGRAAGHRRRRLERRRARRAGRRAAGRQRGQAGRGAARGPARRRARARRGRRAARRRRARCARRPTWASTSARWSCAGLPTLAAGGSGWWARQQIRDLCHLPRRAGQPARRGGAARAAGLADGRACRPTPWPCSRSARASGAMTLLGGRSRRGALTLAPEDARRLAAFRAWFAGERERAPRLGLDEVLAARRAAHAATTCTCSRCRAARGGWPTSTSCCAWRPPTRRATGATCAASSTWPPPSSRPRRASPTRRSSSAASTRCA